MQVEQPAVVHRAELPYYPERAGAARSQFMLVNGAAEHLPKRRDWHAK